jgi:hypothetical protein
LASTAASTRPTTGATSCRDSDRLLSVEGMGAGPTATGGAVQKAPSYLAACEILFGGRAYNLRKPWGATPVRGAPIAADRP